MTGAITVVGLGLVPDCHLTLEGRALLDATRILYVIDSVDAFRRSFAGYHGELRSLDDLFDVHESRLDALAAIADHLVAASRQAGRVVLATLGNPMVASGPLAALAARARSGDITLRIVPAVSAMDVFFTDLGVDPVRTGLQVLSADRAALASSALPCVLYSPAYAGDVSSRSRMHSAARLARDLLEVYGNQQSFWVYSRSRSGVALSELPAEELVVLALAGYLGDKLVAGPVSLLPLPLAEVCGARPCVLGPPGDHDHG